MIDPSNNATPLEQPSMVASSRRSFTIGLPKCNVPFEHRFPLTPEAVDMLSQQGFVVRIESGAASPIHYTDMQYAARGAQIVDRDTALRSDIVVHLSPLEVRDIRRMRRGAMLLTLLGLPLQTREAIRELLARSIIAIALDLIEDNHANRPFADILAEIDGRAAITMASAMLADSVRGKGIMLGGISGIIPCETTIIGSGIAAVAAARTAAGNGAIVRIFDNDVYRLRHATRQLGEWAVGSVLYPHVLGNALRSADVVVVTDLSIPFSIDGPTASLMKNGVLIFDLSSEWGQTFPSLPVVDLSTVFSGNTRAERYGGRLCYANASSAVPRTAAMAISNTLITTMHEMMTCEGMINALKLLPGLQKAAYTFLGKVVNRRIAQIARERQVDINIFLTLS